MTVMGDAGMEGLSDAGSIPARSTITEQIELRILSYTGIFVRSIEANNDTAYRQSDIQCRYFYCIMHKIHCHYLAKSTGSIPGASSMEIFTP